MKQYSAKQKIIIVREVLKSSNRKRILTNYEVSERTLYYWLSKIKKHGKICVEALEACYKLHKIWRKGINRLEICLFR